MTDLTALKELRDLLQSGAPCDREMDAQIAVGIRHLFDANGPLPGWVVALNIECGTPNKGQVCALNDGGHIVAHWPALTYVSRPYDLTAATEVMERELPGWQLLTIQRHINGRQWHASLNAPEMYILGDAGPSMSAALMLAILNAMIAEKEKSDG